METQPFQNNLYPVFLCLDKLNVLIVGGGNVGLEKVGNLLKCSPDAHVKLIAPTVLDEIKELLNHPHFTIEERAFVEPDLKGIQLIIIATEQAELNAEIKALATAKNILANVADTPAICDFYLGSIVQKGNLKLGISTNGKSPTVAKRIKEVLNESIPDEINETLENVQQIRNRLKGDFAEKVRQLNKLTALLISETKIG
jgi:siroheme synthase-like protein